MSDGSRWSIVADGKSVIHATLPDARTHAEDFYTVAAKKEPVAVEASEVLAYLAPGQVRRFVVTIKRQDGYEARTWRAFGIGNGDGVLVEAHDAVAAIRDFVRKKGTMADETRIVGYTAGLLAAIDVLTSQVQHLEREMCEAGRTIERLEHDLKAERESHMDTRKDLRELAANDPDA